MLLSRVIQPPESFAPRDILVGEGVSGQRNIFGLGFTDPAMRYTPFELEVVARLNATHPTLNSLLRDSGIEETQILRFLQGCGWDVNVARESLLEYIAWRSIQPTKVCMSAESTDTSFLYWSGVDKCYRPILVINCKKLTELQYAHGGNNEFIYEVAVSTLLHFVNHMAVPGKVEQVVVIVNLNDCTAWDTPTDFIQKVAKTLTSFFRSRLSRMYIINSPFLFYALWGVIKCLLSDRTVAKISIHRYDFMDQLLEQIEIDQIHSDLLPKTDSSSSSSSCSTW